MANGKNKKKRWIIISVVAVAVIALVVVAVAATRGGTKIDPTKLAKVEKGDLAKSVVATGKVTPITKVEIKSKASGIVKKLDVDAGALGRLLDDRLILLPRLVDRGLVDQLQLLAVLGADAVGALGPAGLVEEGVGLIDVELVLGGLGAEALRVVEEIRRRNAGAAVDVCLD